MQGAREYAQLFATGQYGRLYITSGSHARGRTFRIQVLPEGEKAIENGENNTCLNADAVEVYGVTDGQRGWTESYGWIHRGPWEDDFLAMVDQRKAEIRADDELREARRKSREDAEAMKTQRLLQSY